MRSPSGTSSRGVFIGIPPSDVLMESRPCPLGCPPDDTPVLVGRDRLHWLPGEFQVVRCRVCGLLRTDPRPAPEAISFYYPADYGPYLYTRVATTDERDLRPRWRRRLSRVVQAAVRVNAERLPAMSPGWMLLEHLHDPIRALKKLWIWTKPGGWLVVSVPNADCYEFALFREAWFALQLPTHLYHFTPETLATLLDRSDWRLEKIFYHRDLRNLLGSFSYVLSDRGIFNRLARRLSEFPERGGRLSQLLHPLAVVLSALGQTGRMTAWARRVD